MSRSEQKILIVICYYIVVSVVFLTGFADASRKADIFKENFYKYLLCEQSGHDPNNPCDRSVLETFSYILTIFSYGLHGILPLVNLIFTIDFREINMKCHVMVDKVKTSLSESRIT